MVRLVLLANQTMVLIHSLASIFFTSAVSAVLVQQQQQQQQQPKAPSANFDSSLRDITWGQLNFVHTTDTHGWLPGHLLEPNFNSDWGDLISFVSHLSKKADEMGVDLLLVDSGDRHDGNGLSDATNPHAIYTEKLFTQMDYDLITIGNHELYRWEDTLQDYYIIKPAYGEKYVVSNVDLLIDGKWAPMGNRYRRFKTKNQGFNVVGFGFLFDFRGNNANTRVTRCEDAVQEDWFAEALSYNDTDVFVIASHIPIRYFREMKVIIGAIRDAHPFAIIQFLGGHSHIRDFAVVDERSTALESGRFLETVGWVSADKIDTKSADSQVEFTRAYIDVNLRSFSHHTNTSLEEKREETDNTNDYGLEYFHTSKGQEVTQKIKKFRKSLDLDKTYGCVPRNYLTDRAAFPGKNSLYSLLQDSVLNRLVGDTVPKERSTDHPRFILINTGSIRFDMFAGPYTKDTGYIISPFASNWQYIPDVPLKYARRILPELNKYSYIMATESGSESGAEIETEAGVNLDVSLLKNPQQRAPFYHMQSGPTPNENTESEIEDFDGSRLDSQTPLKNPAQLTPGYVTCDDYGCTGDDTPHKGWPFNVMPNAIQAQQHVNDTRNGGDDGDDTLVDVVIYSFLVVYLADVYQKIGYHNYSILPYGGPSTIELLTGHVQDVWGTC